MEPKFPSFFLQGKAKCAMYSRTRDSDEAHYARGRAFIEKIWQECAPFVDSNARHHAKEDLPSVFWELYLAHALRRSGISIVAQPRRKKSQRGPDLFAADPPVWIEAVVPTSGTGPDALKRPPLGVVFDVPVDSYVLRLRSAIESKARIVAEYIRDGIVPTGEATVIAISACMLESQFSELPIPRIVRAAFGVGDLVLNLDCTTGKTVSHEVEKKELVRKAKGTPIKTDIFRDPAYSHISAILYSYTDWINCPYEPGAEFMLIHNSAANTPLPRGWLSTGKEYWLDGDAVSWKEYPKRSVS